MNVCKDYSDQSTKRTKAGKCTFWNLINSRHTALCVTLKWVGTASSSPCADCTVKMPKWITADDVLYTKKLNMRRRIKCHHCHFYLLAGWHRLQRRSRCQMIGTSFRRSEFHCSLFHSKTWEHSFRDFATFFVFFCHRLFFICDVRKTTECVASVRPPADVRDRSRWRQIDNKWSLV